MEKSGLQTFRRGHIANAAKAVGEIWYIGVKTGTNRHVYNCHNGLPIFVSRLTFLCALEMV